MTDLPIDDNYTLPAACLSWTAERATGPGGQHVNKTSSAVELRFDLFGPHGLDADSVARLRSLAGRRVGQDGVLTLVSLSSRSQLRNLETARERLAELVRQARVPPSERLATKVPRRQKVARLSDKRLHAEKKRGRSGPRGEDH